MVKIKFDEDDATITNIVFNDSYLNLTKKAQENEVLKELQEDVEMDFANTSRKSRLNSLMLNASISFVTTKSEGKIPSAKFLKDLNVDIISTFDEPISYIEDKSKWDSLHDEGVWSSLDKELHELQEQYSWQATAAKTTFIPHPPLDRRSRAIRCSRRPSLSVLRSQHPWIPH